MGISQFPPASTGESGASFDFVVDMADTENNVIQLPQTSASGAYSISFASAEPNFDIYFVNEDSIFQGYTNQNSIVANGGFDTVVVLGASPTQLITFAFVGPVSDATSEGNEPGAGAYLESLTPSDLPNQDDSTTITGGNFDSDLRVFFIGQDGNETEAKAVTVTTVTEAIVVRPDELPNDESPYSLKVKNNDTPAPVGTNQHILSDSITTGLDPVWITTGFVTPFYTANNGYTATIEATDPEASAVTYSIINNQLQNGLTLNATTGEISGTTSLIDSRLITFRATDAGGNTADQTLMVSYAGILTEDSPPEAFEDLAYSYQFQAEIEDEINFFDVNQDDAAYIFNGSSNPTLELIRGEVHQFAIDATGNPFHIQTTPAPFDSNSQYTTGITGSGTQVGTLDWTIDNQAPNELYYVSSTDANFTGQINIIDQPNPAIGTPIFTLQNGTLPAGVSLSNDGLLSGTPSNSGTFTGTIRATFVGQSFVETNYSINGQAITVEQFTASGTYTAPITGNIGVILVSGGGGGMQFGGNFFGSASATAGGNVRAFFQSVTQGQSAPFTVGAGGAGGSGQNNTINKGSFGGATSMFSQTANGGTRENSPSSHNDSINNSNQTFSQTTGGASTGAGGDAESPSKSGPGYLILNTQFAPGGSASGGQNGSTNPTKQPGTGSSFGRGGAGQNGQNGGQGGPGLVRIFYHE